MMRFLWFFLGTLFGGIVGVITMCLFQINRYRKEENTPKE